MERNIRHTKNKLIALREGIDAADDAGVKANLEAEYAKTAKLLGRQNQAYNDFCKENGLKRLSDRIQVAKWTREDAKQFKKFKKWSCKWARTWYNTNG